MAKRKSTKGKTTIYKTKDRVKLEYQTFVLNKNNLLLFRQKKHPSAKIKYKQFIIVFYISDIV
jgi:hypothetical protein